MDNTNNTTSLPSLPDLMDMELDVDLPEDLFDIDNAYMDEYLKKVRDDTTASGMLLPSLDLDIPVPPPQALPIGSEPATSEDSHHFGRVAAPPNASHASGSQGMETGAFGSHIFASQAYAVPSAAAQATAGQQVFGIPEPEPQISHTRQMPVMAESSHGAQGTSTRSGEADSPEDAPAPRKRGGPKGASGGSSARKVTPQRKQNNRKAQQRYREKRKMQAVEKEEQVKLLSAQVAALQSLQTQNQQVSIENEELKRTLHQQQIEIDALKKLMAEMDIGPNRDNSGHSSGGGELDLVFSDELDDGDSADGGGGDAGGSGGRRGGVARAVSARRAPPIQTAHDEATALLQELTQGMRKLLLAHGLPDTKYLPGDERYNQPSLLEGLVERVQKADRASMERLLTRPISPLERTACNSRSMASAHPCSQFRAMWLQILGAMAIDDTQAEALLAARATTLERLRALYNERLELNATTMSIMLPRPSPVKSEEGNEHSHDDCFDGSLESKVERKMAMMGQFGGKCALSHAQRLAEALDKIRGNLRAEQRVMVQLHSVLVLKVLSTPQAALMFILAGESLVEPLHVTNLLALQRGVIELLPFSTDSVAAAQGAVPAPAAGPDAAVPAPIPQQSSMMSDTFMGDPLLQQAIV